MHRMPAKEATRLRLLPKLALVAATIAVAISLQSQDGRQMSPSRMSPGADAGEAAREAGAPRYQAGWRNVTIEREDGGSFTAILTYPARAAGENAEYEESGAPYPAVSFGHGFFQEPSRYQGLYEHLARSGYFVIAPGSHTGLLPNHEEFAEDLGRSLSWLSERNVDPASWLNGAVDAARTGLSGHSMGGGACLLAAAGGTPGEISVGAIAPLAAADTRPSVRNQMAQIEAPLSLIVGSDDSIVPPESTRRLYEAAQAPKQLVTIVGGYHCGFQDDPFPIGCDSGALPREQQLAITRERLTAFFDLHLKGDEELRSAVWGEPGDPRVRLEAEPEGFAARPIKYLPWLGYGR